MRARVLWVAMFLVVTVGCYRVRPLWEPEAYLARAKPVVVYVRQRNRPPVTVMNPRLTGDTLHGTGLSGGPVALAWADVLDVYARRIDGRRTMFAVSSMTVLTGVMIYAFVQEANGSFGPACDPPLSAYEHEMDPECSTPR